VARIAYVSPLYFADESYIGGGERYPTNLARGVVLGSGGRHQVDLISFGKVPGRRPIAPGVDLVVLAATGDPGNPLDILSWDLPAALAGADLVHIHQAYTRCTEVGLLIAKQLRKPVCLTDHGGDTSRLGKHYGLPDLADAIVPNSDFAASFFGDAKAPIVVIKGGVDTGRFTPSATPVVRSYILYAGRLLPHKGVDRLVRAIPDDLPLVVCGPAYHRPYEEHVRDLGRGKSVEFRGVVDDETLLDLYRHAWANVLPSIHTDCYGNYYAMPELMGLTLLEAMACGTPAIGSNLAGMPEFIRHGETGYVFDTPEELRDQVVRLAGEPGLVDRMGRAGRQAVEAEFSLEVAGAKMAALYDRIIASRSVDAGPGSPIEVAA